MEQMWTTRQVMTLVMGLATGLHLADTHLTQPDPFRAIDQMLASCVEFEENETVEEIHLEAFERSLEPGFFEEAALPKPEAKTRPEFHHDVMQLSDHRFINLVAHLSKHDLHRINRPGSVKHGLHEDL